MLAQPRDEEFDHATRVVAGFAGADAEIADTAQQLEGCHVGADLTGRGGGVEQLGAYRHEAVQEVGVQRLEGRYTATMRSARVGKWR